MIGRAGSQRILEEVAKCDTVCANCHRLRTFRRRSAIRCGSAVGRVTAFQAVCRGFESRLPLQTRRTMAIGPRLGYSDEPNVDGAPWRSPTGPARRVEPCPRCETGFRTLHVDEVADERDDQGCVLGRGADKHPRRRSAPSIVVEVTCEAKTPLFRSDFGTKYAALPPSRTSKSATGTELGGNARQHESFARMDLRKTQNALSARTRGRIRNCGLGLIRIQMGTHGMPPEAAMAHPSPGWSDRCAYKRLACRQPVNADSGRSRLWLASTS